MINKEKIKKIISEINESLNEIKKLISMNQDELFLEKRNIAALKYFLLQAIEGVGTICVHISAKIFNKSVSSFGECFEVLEENKIIDQELSERLKKMIKFRNKLIHRYWDIDDNLLVKYAKEDLNDFDDFINSIKKILYL